MIAGGDHFVEGAAACAGGVAVGGPRLIVHGVFGYIIFRDFGFDSSFCCCDVHADKNLCSRSLLFGFMMRVVCNWLFYFS